MQTVFYARFNGMFRPIQQLDILYISANKNYSDIFTANKGKISICVSLREVEEQITQNLFCRIHRSHIISIHQITGYTYTHVHIGKEVFPIGKTYFDNFMQRTRRIQCGKDKMIEEEIKNMSVEDYLKTFASNTK